MKVLVCGGRGFYKESLVIETLDSIHAETPITLIIEGGAKGADELARVWARRRKVPNQTYEANWLKLGKDAGFQRNQQMLDEGKPDLVIAFPGGAGTDMMVGLAKKQGIEVRRPKGAQAQLNQDEA